MFAFDSRVPRIVLVSALLAACGSSNKGQPDGGRAVDASIDAEDGAADGSIDAGDGTTIDGGIDAAIDAGIDAATPPGPGEIGDNGAILQGDEVTGTGSADRRRIEVSTSGVAQLVVGPAYITKAFPNSPNSKLVIEVTNRGDQAYCRVALLEVQFLDATGTNLAAPADLFILGAVRHVTANATTDTCLAPGERAFALGGISNVAPERVARLRLRVNGEASAAFTPANAKLGPVSYRVTNNDVFVRVENTGSRPGRITQVHMVHLDADGVPLGSEQMRVNPADRDVAAAGSVEVFDDSPLFLGASNRLYVRVGFEDL
jgi:hypothetical protein